MSIRGPNVSYVLAYKEDKFHKFGVNRLLIRGSGSDGERLYSCGRDGTIHVWDLRRAMNFGKNGHGGDDTRQWQETAAVADHQAGKGASSKQRLDDQIVPEAVFVGSNHSDWVNDMILLSGNHRNKLISCSNDNTVMLWDMSHNQEKHLHTYRYHRDYCKCLAHSSEGNFFVSGGFDNTIAFWDIETMTRTFENKTRFTPHILRRQKNSVYSLAVDPRGSALVSGSTDKFLRVFDPRTGDKVMKLRGHQDMVKSVLIDDTATKIVSASSDGTVKTWDMRQQRCFHSYHVHKDSVWTLAFDEARGQDYVISGGRDKNVYYFDTRQDEVCHLLHAENPVLSLAVTPDRDFIWVSTVDSKITKWHLKKKLDNVKPKKIGKAMASPSFTRLGASPLRTSEKHKKPSLGPLNYPVTSIPGSPGILRHHILNDRRHVLTQDSDGNVAKWDITSGKVEELGKAAFEECIKEFFQLCSIPNWFTVMCKTGSLEIVLEPPSVFNAEIYASDAGFDVLQEEDKINLGAMVVKALFKDWFVKRKAKIRRQTSVEESRSRPQREHDKQEEQDVAMKDDEQESMPDASDAADNNEVNDSKHGSMEKGDGDQNDNEDGDEKMSNLEKELHRKDAPVTPLSSSDSKQTTESSVSDATSASTNGKYESIEEGEEEKEIQEQEFYHFTLPKSTKVIVHHEMLNPVLSPFKKMLKDINGSEIEYKAIPRWIVNVLSSKRVQPSVSQKIGFFLESHDTKGMPHLRESKSKLTAHRILKIKKVYQYILQNLQIRLPTRREWLREQQLLHAKEEAPTKTKQSGTRSKLHMFPHRRNKSPLQPNKRVSATSDSSLQQATEKEMEDENSPVSAEEYIEILCNDRVLSPNIDLGTVNTFFRGDQRVIVLQYRKRRANED